MEERKGFDLNALIGLGVTFLVIAIVLSFGGKIVDNMQESIRDTESGSVYNETLSSFGSDVWVNLATSGRCGLVSCTFLHGSNESPLQNITITNSSHFNISGAGRGPCEVKIVVGEEGIVGTDNLSNFNMSYSWSAYECDSAYNASEYGLESIEEFSGWLPTLALIIIAAVIIGIVIRYFMVRGTEY